MNHFSHALEKFAVLFSYPQPGYLKAAEGLYTLLPEQQQKLAAAFLNYCQNAPFTAVEERFTLTFDMNPATCLEVGWHLFGEDYKRGQFLVYMRQTLADHQIKESVELPDHLSHCLRLLAVLSPDEAKAYVQSYLLKPLKKIFENLDTDNPYRGLVRVLLIFLQQEFNVNEHNETVSLPTVSSIGK